MMLTKSMEMALAFIGLGVNINTTIKPLEGCENCLEIRFVMRFQDPNQYREITSELGGGVTYIGFIPEEKEEEKQNQ